VTTVLDASALLAFLQGEPGADVVETAMENGPVCGAANWSEIAQKIHAADRDWDLVKALLMSYELQVEPVTSADAELAAQRWHRGEGRSLADRLCLALGERLDADVLTADTHWGTAGRIRQIR
jgi:PIN domain nuclease of toxin-antitoxin system